MYSIISFPSLGIEINPPFGIFNIRFYGIILTFGILLAVYYCTKRCNEFNIAENDILDGVMWIVPISILCARFYYCIFSEHWEDYKSNIFNLLNIRQGGLAIYGGIIGAIVCIVIYTKIRKINLLSLLDLVSLGFLIGQSIGRWGNFFNREAFGCETDSLLRMGLYDKVSEQFIYYHPTFLYESVWNLIGFLILHKLSKNRKYEGQIILSYIAWYGLGRAMIEGLRTDSLYIGDFRVSQLIAVISFIISMSILIYNYIIKKDKL